MTSSLSLIAKALKPRWPRVLCALTTIVAAPFWLFALVNLLLPPEGLDCPAGLILIAPAILLVSVTGIITLGILNPIFIAPYLARPLKMRLRLFTPVTFNLTLLICSGLVVFAWLSALQRGYVPSYGLICFWGPLMLMFFGPPVILGSLVYSLVYLSQSRVSCDKVES
jgi:hypothetical protein